MPTGAGSGGAGLGSCVCRGLGVCLGFCVGGLGEEVVGGVGGRRLAAAVPGAQGNDRHGQRVADRELAQAAGDLQRRPCRPGCAVPAGLCRAGRAVPAWAVPGSGLLGFVL
jgi:hypothetical protein